MTWEEWMKYKSTMKHWGRDLLKAFADELVKRLREDVENVYGVPHTLFPSIINQLLTEAGVER